MPLVPHGYQLCHLHGGPADGLQFIWPANVEEIIWRVKGPRLACLWPKRLPDAHHLYRRIAGSEHFEHWGIRERARLTDQR